MSVALNPTRRMRRELEAENKRWPEHLVSVPREAWPSSSILPEGNKPVEVWRSRAYLVQVFGEPNGIERLSVCRTSHDGDRWLGGIAWDDLQRLKSECGRGGKDAVEIFPADADVVNVTNMRHLFVMPDALPFAWRHRR